MLLFTERVLQVKGRLAQRQLMNRKFNLSFLRNVPSLEYSLSNVPLQEIQGLAYEGKGGGIP